MKSFLAIIYSIGILLFSCSEHPLPEQTEKKESINTKQTDPYLLIGEKNFLTGFEPVYPDGDINVIVEIPTGTVEKWEVEKKSGNMIWEFRNGEPRTIKYLGYPGNYGMIPQTLLPEELGGDGDPLDVIVLGPAVKRGSVIKVKLIGVLKLLDDGEQDDKLIAVMEDTPFYTINSLNQLNTNFNGAASIVETFFSNYKGPGEMESLGLMNETEARKILDDAVEAYKK